MLKFSSLILKLQCMALWLPAFKEQYLNFYYFWESVDGGGIGKFLVVGAVGSSMGEIWKEWGSVLGCGGR